MSKVICIGAFSLSIALAFGRADATVVNIDMVPSGNATYSGTAVAPDAGSFWNAYIQENWSGGSASGLLASDGVTPTGISLSSTSANVVKLVPAGATNLLLDDGAGMNVDTPPYTVTFVLAGLTTGQKYDLYLYGTVGSFYQQGSVFTVAGESRRTEGGNNSSFVEGGLTSSPLVAGSNYVRFVNLSPDTNNQITIAWADGGQHWGPLNGLQLVSVPEPCTMGMGFIGCVGILAYAWRKRR